MGGRFPPRSPYKLCTDCKDIANWSIDVIVDDFDRFDFCFLEVDNLPSPKFCFLTSSRKLVFAISFPFQLNFLFFFIFSFSAYNNNFFLVLKLGISIAVDVL